MHKERLNGAALFQCQFPETNKSRSTGSFSVSTISGLQFADCNSKQLNFLFFCFFLGLLSFSFLLLIFWPDFWPDQARILLSIGAQQVENFCHRPFFRSCTLSTDLGFPSPVLTCGSTASWDNGSYIVSRGPSDA